jgi:hypothetical protein
MTAYSATFADNTVLSLKDSRREYSHAWRVTYRGPGDTSDRTMTGWAGTEELARKAMDTETRWCRRQPRDWARYSRGKAWVAGTIVSEELAPAIKG